jgi:SOS-response transcriptional repressor LexA
MDEDREKIKNKIVNFAKKEYKKSGIAPSAREINKKFNISFWTYFPQGMSALYRFAILNFHQKKIREKPYAKDRKKDEELEALMKEEGK